MALLELEDSAGCSGGCVDGFDVIPVVFNLDHGLVNAQRRGLTDGVILQISNQI